MVAGVEREYSSELRAAQAVATRQRIVTAAAGLYIRDGYVKCVEIATAASEPGLESDFDLIGAGID
jgi:hypothetical protein